MGFVFVKYNDQWQAEQEEERQAQLLEEHTVRLTFDVSSESADDAAQRSDAAWPGDEMGLWHARLNDQQRAMYDELYPHLRDHEEEFHLSGAFVRDVLENNEEDCMRVTIAILDDHPELFWLSPAAGDVFAFEYYPDDCVLPACNEPLLVGINGYWYTDWKLVNGIWEGTYW